MIKGQDIICFSFSDWDEEMVSNRYHILTRFARNNRVFLFERQLSLDDFPKRWPKILGNFRTKDGLVLITPGIVFPKGIASKFFYRYFLKKLYQKFKIKNPIFWFYNYQLDYILEKYPHQISCYHCTEDYAQSSKISSKIDLVKVIENWEKKFAQKVDLVFAVSEYLTKKHQKINPQTFLAANAVDYQLYRRAQKRSKKTSPPVLGYIGNLSDKVNFQLLCQVAKHFSTLKIVLVGPVVSKNNYLGKLGKMANVSFLGRKPVQELPEYLATFDVCLIPFIQDEWLVKASQPLKLYEYLSSGKPIVSTKMDCLGKYQTLVYGTKTSKEFIKKVSLALKEKNPKLNKERIKIASQNTWDQRFAFINQKMEEFLCQRKKS